MNSKDRSAAIGALAIMGMLPELMPHRRKDRIELILADPPARDLTIQLEIQRKAEEKRQRKAAKRIAKRCLPSAPE